MQVDISISLTSGGQDGAGGSPSSGDALLIEGGTDALLIEGGTDALLLEA